MPTFKQLVHTYKTKCNEHDVPEETVMLYLVEISNRERYDLYANYDDEVPSTLLNDFEKGMERILSHEPMQHVLGYSWFYGYKFVVNEDVLIPRPETEELVAHVLGDIDLYFKDNKEIECVDIGTGSGAIAISLALEEAKIKMHATDISSEAIEVAKINAKNNNINIDFMVGDMLQPIIDKNIKVDVLLCNPPYIPSEEQLEDMVVDYEPHVALFGGKDGMKYYREVFENCQKVLKPKSFMAFEIGWNQKEALLAEVKKTLPQAKAEVHKDINGKDRMLFVYFNC